VGVETATPPPNYGPDHTHMTASLCELLLQTASE